MDYIKSLEADLEKGYSKSDLEKLIGLPKNNLSGILKGGRKLSKKSQLKIERWDKSEKPDPLTLHELVYANGAKIGQVADTKFTELAKGVHKEIVEVPIGELREYVKNADNVIPEEQLKELSEYQIRVDKERIATLESELKHPPKTAIIGVKNWIRTREVELANLKAKYNNE